jgi:hypothetical protein
MIFTIPFPLTFILTSARQAYPHVGYPSEATFSYTLEESRSPQVAKPC